MKEKFAKLRRLKFNMWKENIARGEIEESPEYLEISESMKKLQEERNKLFACVHDSSVECAELEALCADHMDTRGLDTYEGFGAVYKSSKAVSKQKVLEVVGGDIDMFMTMADISQVKLKKFAKDNESSGLKKSLLGCIKEISRTFNGIKDITK